MKQRVRGGFRAIIVAVATLAVLAVPRPSAAQYFGQNKVQFERLKFQVLKTEHFDIYFYEEEKATAEIAGRMAERWYARLTSLLHYHLVGRQPLVLFASHSHFAQTNVVEGLIDEGTGGVTEGLQRRIALPFGATLAETDHVIGHELVHAFQYDILGANTTAPLWFIEGMAEYLSVGPVSVQTAMWLRDAALGDDIPSIKDLDNPRYFPYRFGHGLWAYLAGTYGDDAISQILVEMSPGDDGSPGASASAAIALVIGQPLDVLSAGWKAAVIETYGVKETRPKQNRITEFFPAIISRRTGSGRVNVGPSLSPDGKRIAFLSERSRLAIEAYVADADTAKILLKLTEMDVDPHFESLQFLDSAGSWKPDGSALVFAAVRSGRPVLAVIDAASGKVLNEYRFETLGEIFQPSWSPDGKSIAFAGHAGGVTDLFVYNLDTKTTTRLTDDVFADMAPAWSPDGQTLAFVTDRFSSDLNTLSFGGYRMAVITAAGGTPRAIDTGLKGSEFNPQWTQDGRTLVFVSTAAGAPDVYRVAAGGGVAEPLTAVNTGVSGITEMSASITVAARADRMALTLFDSGGYDIYVLEGIKPQPADTPDAKVVADLPPARASRGRVLALLQKPAEGLPPATPPAITPYSRRMHLVSFNQAAGVGISSAYGAQLLGGVSLLFSDVLGDNLFSVSAQASGGVRDIGAQAFYLNRERRWYWGISGGQIPIASGSASGGYTVIGGQTVFVQNLETFRQTNTEVGFLTAYPLNRTTRLEFNTAARHIGFTRETDLQIYDLNGQLLSHEKTDLDAPESIRMVDFGAAFVRDTSVFAAVGPVKGERTRLEVAPAFGDLRITTLTLDYRHYFMPVSPVTFAIRGIHLGRYGAGAEDERLTPLFIGYPTFVRGYDIGTFRASECSPTLVSSCPEYDRLLGSRMVVANAEVRAPLVGLFKGGLQYGPVPVEVFGFADAGLAWFRGQTPDYQRGWATSVGFGARVNVFGFLIAELDLVKPLNRNRGMLWVFQFRPSW